MHMAAASHPAKVPDSAGSVVRGRAVAVVRTDSATAIDPGRAVAAVVQVRDRDRVRGVGRDLVVEGNAADNVAASP